MNESPPPVVAPPPVCPNCGFVNPPGAMLCQRCGSRLGWRPYEKTSSQKVADCLFIGLFIVVGVPALLFGGCVSILAISGATSQRGPFFAPIGQALALILIPLAIFGVLLYLAFFRQGKPKR